MIPLRVLFIEDSEDDATLQVRLLRQAGYGVEFRRVDSRESLVGALEQSWDIIVSDYSMPHFSGTDALRLVRDRGLEVPFIFVSGTIGEETAVAALKVGAQDYLMKTSLHRLVPAVQREMRDAEERRQRRRLEQEVHQLQRFEAIGRLAGGVAHDFNNVIGAIMGWADIALNQTRLDPRTREHLEKIRAQADRAGALTKQLLAFARRQNLQPRSVDLNGLIRECISLLRNVIGEQINIRLELSKEPCVIWADASQIEQVLMNLCLNARDAMPGGGSLRIETKTVQIGADFQQVHPYAVQGRYVLMSIEDTGTGMDAETLEHIFEPFFSTKEPGRGTGLGLATVYGIVKQHKGIITVDSTPGRGTAFQVYLQPSRDAVEPNAEFRMERMRGGTETILVAEDNEALREAAVEILEGLGYRVLPASDGEAAFREFEKNHEKIDLLFLDVVMPKLSGPEAHALMCEIHPGVPIVFTTGYASEIALVRARSTPGAMILEKPYGSAHLAQKLREALEKRLDEQRQS